MPEDKAPTIDITTGEVRNESVTKLYEKIDKAIDDVTDTDKMSFHEIDVALLRINHKLDQEVCNLYSYSKSMSNPRSKKDLVIFNPNANSWKKIPIEIKLYFKPGFMENNFEVYSNGQKIQSQLEDVKFFKNGHIRSVTLVITPSIQKKSYICVTLMEVNEKSNSRIQSSNLITTKKAEVLLSELGGCIENIKFPYIMDKPIISTTKHTNYNNTSTTNFLSGQIFTMDKNDKKSNDLIRTKIVSEEGNLPIRKKFSCELELPFGDLTKFFYVYENTSRIDLKYIFTFKDYRPSIFRINLINLKSDNFNPNSFSYSTNNGGNLESFS